MSGPLRVLQVIDSLDPPGGAERSVSMLAPHLLRDEGVEVHIAYLLDRVGYQQELRDAGVGVHSLADGEPSRRRWVLRAKDVIGALQPDLVHTTLFEADLAGRRAAASLGVPCISSLVNTAYGRIESGGSGGLHPFKVRAAQAADAFTARHVTRFHAITEHVATVMRRRLLIPAHKIEIIPRGRDPQVLGRRTAERAADMRRQLGVGDVPLILAVGRHEPQKAFDVLFNALPTVLAQYPEAHVCVAGRAGRSTPKLEELIRAHGLGETVTFLGVRDDVADLMAAADVLAFPSLWEGAGGTLLEAMALECPVVASRLPAVSETLDDATAELVVPGDPGDLARGLMAVLADRRAASDRAGLARKRFEKDFTIEVSAALTAALYRRVTGRLTSA